MPSDFRETLIGCQSATCRYNVQASTERTCMLKIISLDETGRCRYAEARPVVIRKEQQPPHGHFKGGAFVP